MLAFPTLGLALQLLASVEMRGQRTFPWRVLPPLSLFFLGGGWPISSDWHLEVQSTGTLPQFQTTLRAPFQPPSFLWDRHVSFMTVCPWNFSPCLILYFSSSYRWRFMKTCDILIASIHCRMYCVIALHVGPTTWLSLSILCSYNRVHESG